MPPTPKDIFDPNGPPLLSSMRGKEKSSYHFKAFLEREMYLQISVFHDANTLAFRPQASTMMYKGKAILGTPGGSPLST
jgi:hypothetical protein